METEDWSFLVEKKKNVEFYNKKEKFFTDRLVSLPKWCEMTLKHAKLCWMHSTHDPKTGEQLDSKETVAEKDEKFMGVYFNEDVGKYRRGMCYDNCNLIYMDSFKNPSKEVIIGLMNDPFQPSYNYYLQENKDLGQKIAEMRFRKAFLENWIGRGIETIDEFIDIKRNIAKLKGSIKKLREEIKKGYYIVFKVSKGKTNKKKRRSKADDLINNNYRRIDYTEHEIKEKKELIEKNKAEINDMSRQIKLKERLTCLVEIVEKSTERAINDYKREFMDVKAEIMYSMLLEKINTSLRQSLRDDPEKSLDLDVCWKKVREERIRIKRMEEDQKVKNVKKLKHKATYYLDEDGNEVLLEAPVEQKIYFKKE